MNQTIIGDLINQRVVKGKNGPPTDVATELWRRLYMFRNFFSHSLTINLVPSVVDSSPKENDSELSDKTGGRKSGVPRLQVLIG